MEIKDVWIRNFLRILAGIIMLVYVFDIMVHKIKEGKIYLDINDGYVILGCIALLLAVEGVRAYVKRKLNKIE